MPVLRIVAGSYERLLFGYALDTATAASEQLFAFGAHIGCIKSVAISPRAGGVLATGGQDELIKVFSLRTMRSMGELFLHNATVSALAAFETTHLMSGDENGKLVMWRTKDWEPLTTLKGHKAAIAGIAIHPSGKLALTVAADRQIICWNLLRGLKASKTRLPDTPCAIQFSPSGSTYAILFNHMVVLYDTASTSTLATHASPQVRLNAFAFIDERRVAIGAEDGSFIAIEISEAAEPANDAEEEEEEERAIRTIATFARTAKPTSRIRSVQCTSFTAEDGTTLHYVAAASSTGGIAVWEVPADAKCEPVQPIAELDAKCRLTCLAIDALDAALVDEDEVEETEAAAEEAEAEAEVEVEVEEEVQPEPEPEPTPAPATPKSAAAKVATAAAGKKQKRKAAAAAPAESDAAAAPRPAAKKAKTRH
ncbi:Protein mak11 [Blastocladiella emersonii ATCC 22665]|nr:Protein mak11 [Blastocladiella emersonii ATCC 22665]